MKSRTNFKSEKRRPGLPVAGDLSEVAPRPIVLASGPSNRHRSCTIVKLKNFIRQVHRSVEMAVLTIDELREAALKLDVAQRESLICELVQSLDIPDTAADVDQDDEWTAELLRRSDEVRSGLVQPRDWRESIADLKQQLRESAES